MKKLKEDMLAPIEFDLGVAHRGELNESILRRFGTVVKFLLGRMFGNSTRPIRIRGTRREVDAFQQALGKEKKYMDAYLRYGLDNPQTLSNRHNLEAAIRSFERDTGLKWPLK